MVGSYEVVRRSFQRQRSKWESVERGKGSDVFGEGQVAQFIWIKGKGIMGNKISKIN